MQFLFVQLLYHFCWGRHLLHQLLQSCSVGLSSPEIMEEPHPAGDGAVSPGIIGDGASPLPLLPSSRQSSLSSSRDSPSFCSEIEFDVELVDHRDRHPQSELEEIPSWRWLSPLRRPLVPATHQPESEELEQIFFNEDVVMAKPVVSFLVGKLMNYVFPDVFVLLGLSNQMKLLERELRRAQCLLNDADAKRKGDDERVNNWVREVREVACQAEDVIDALVLKIKRRRQVAGVLGFVDRNNRFVAECRKLGKEMEGLKGKLREISDSMITNGIEDLGGSAVGEQWHQVEGSVQERRRA